MSYEPIDIDSFREAAAEELCFDNHWYIIYYCILLILVRISHTIDNLARGEQKIEKGYP